jgi:ketosteroid isomerase-like protein
MKSPAKTTAKPKRQVALNESDVKNFLTRYKKAWETRDADLAARLFTRDVQYYRDPFTAPVVGREAIHNYWAGAGGRQHDIHFTVGASVHSGYIVVAEWTCSYKSSSGERNELAGVFLADFYGKQVRTFRQYSHTRAR